MTDFERKITSEKALDAAIRQLKTQDDWFLTTKTGLAKRIVTLYDEIIAAADFPVSLPVRDVLNYSSAAFMNYVKLGCNYITRKFNVRHSPTTVYSYGYNYSNEALHEKASYPYTIDDFFADPLRKSLFVIGCYNYLHDVIDGKIKPAKMTEAKAEAKPPLDRCPQFRLNESPQGTQNPLPVLDVCRPPHLRFRLCRGPQRPLCRQTSPKVRCLVVRPL